MFVAIPTMAMIERCIPAADAVHQSKILAQSPQEQRLSNVARKFTKGNLRQGQHTCCQATLCPMNSESLSSPNGPNGIRMHNM